MSTIKLITALIRVDVIPRKESLQIYPATPATINAKKVGILFNFIYFEEVLDTAPFIIIAAEATKPENMEVKPPYFLRPL